MGPSSRLVRAKGVEQASVWSAPSVCPAGPVDAVFIRTVRGRSHRAKGGMFAFVPTWCSIGWSGPAGKG
jgi:hypothetical protein